MYSLGFQESYLVHKNMGVQKESKTKRKIECRQRRSLEVQKRIRHGSWILREEEKPWDRFGSIMNCQVKSPIDMYQGDRIMSRVRG